jgi:phage shock protein PspC (stress-responsive transcriptional regulator)
MEEPAGDASPSSTGRRPDVPRDSWPAGDGARPWRRWLGNRRSSRRGLARLAGGGPVSAGPLRRGREDRLAGGVAAGLAARTGHDVTVIRIGFVVATLVTVGAAVYVLAWLLVPMTGEDNNIASRALSDRRGITLAVGLASVLSTLLVIGSAVGAGWLGSVAWPLVIAAAGLVLIWRNAPADEQVIMRRLAEPLPGLADGSSRSLRVLRVLTACVLLGVAGALLSHSSRVLLRPLGGVILVIAAIVVLLGPWWLRIARDLMVERQARIRAEERADMAARVHDSVLQTLALIQRRARDPQQVIQLARAQERELRSWLFDGRAPGSLDGDGMTLAGGVRLIQQEVEAQHGVAVSTMTWAPCWPRRGRQPSMP